MDQRNPTSADVPQQKKPNWLLSFTGLIPVVFIPNDTLQTVLPVALLVLLAASTPRLGRWFGAHYLPQQEVTANRN